VSGDGAVPMLCNILDGNVTDDTTHWDTWQTLRGILGRSDFLYVADSKLCVKETLLAIDRAQGRFITVVPRTRGEVAAFYNELYDSRVRWERLYAKRSSRKMKRLDVFEIATGFYQLQEGFRLFWYRSSEKARKDAAARDERLARARKSLNTLAIKRKGLRTVAGCKKAVDVILAKYRVADLLVVSVEAEFIETYRQTSRGKPSVKTTYKRVVKTVPKIIVKEHVENLARAKATDGVFPLVTNTSLAPIDVLKNYKHQPFLEKRHSLLKSVLEVAPIFLKRNTRINALVFVYFIAQLIAALLERQVRLAMIDNHIASLPVLPEERHSHHPSAAQILTPFSFFAKSHLYNRKSLIKVFVDPFSQVQKDILALLKLSEKRFLETT
jgi:transposase